jgi:hypothetical protein
MALDAFVYGRHAAATKTATPDMEDLQIQMLQLELAILLKFGRGVFGSPAT